MPRDAAHSRGRLVGLGHDCDTPADNGETVARRVRRNVDIIDARDAGDDIARQRIARDEARAYYTQPLTREWWTV